MSKKINKNNEERTPSVVAEKHTLMMQQYRHTGTNNQSNQITNVLLKTMSYHQAT
jgi:hypothetical protein